MTLNLRGHKNRVLFVSTHVLMPVSHQKLLKGQSKKSVTGDELTDRYYTFIYNRKGDTKKKTFICGYSVAEDLLKLTHQEKLPLFNPLKSECHEKEKTEDSTNKNIINARQWHPLAKELSESIDLLITCRNLSIDGVLAEIKVEVDKYYYAKPFESRVKAVNTIIGRLSPNKTLEEQVSLLSEHNNMKTYSFKRLNDVLKNNDLNSNFSTEN